MNGYHWVEHSESSGWREWRLVRDSDTAVVSEIWNSGNGVYHANHGGGEFLDLEQAKAVCEKSQPKIRVVRDSDTVEVGPYGITVKSGESVVSVSSAGVSISTAKPKPEPKPEAKPEPIVPEEPSYRTTGLIQHWWAKFWKWVQK